MRVKLNFVFIFIRLKYFLNLIDDFFVNSFLFSLLFTGPFITRKHSTILSIRQKNVKNLKLKKNSFNLFNNNFFVLFFFNKNNPFLRFFYNSIISYFAHGLKKVNVACLQNFKKTFGEGFLFVRGLLIILILDSLITDDEPLWEPIEWSLVQTWLFFIFIFAWIAENLITSRYGSYTGRDKRVWFGWHKTFWLIELWYILCFGATAMFVIVPFYYELTYTVSFVFSWWHWYNRIFFFKFISVYTIILITAHFFQINLKWLNWKKNIFFILLILVFLIYLLYTQFITAFFSYFTDPLWYQKTRFIDYVQLSHEPLKWGWGPAKRDHFTYHKVTTVFWFKNDSPFAGAFLMINLFFVLFLFFLVLYWLVLLRKTYALREISFTFASYCVSALKQFFYFFLLFYFFIFISFIVCYWRFPIEFIWTINSNSWIINFFFVFKDYYLFLFSFFF